MSFIFYFSTPKKGIVLFSYASWAKDVNESKSMFVS